MAVKIKKITYLVPPRDLLDDTVDVLVTLEDDYCAGTDRFCYVVEVTTPQALSAILKEEKSEFLSPGYPYIIVSKLTNDILRAAIESFINTKDDSYWLKLYHVILSLEIEDLNEILDRQKRESIEFAAEIDAELEDESDTNDS